MMISTDSEKQLRGLYALKPDWNLFSWFVGWRRSMAQSWKDLPRADWKIWLAASLIPDRRRAMGAIALCCMDEAEDLSPQFANFYAKLLEWSNDGITTDAMDKIAQYMFDHLSRISINDLSLNITHRIATAYQMMDRDNKVFPLYASYCLDVRKDRTYLTFLDTAFPYQEIKDRLIQKGL